MAVTMPLMCQDLWWVKVKRNQNLQACVTNALEERDLVSWLILMILPVPWF